VRASLGGEPVRLDRAEELERGMELVARLPEVRIMEYWLAFWWVFPIALAICITVCTVGISGPYRGTARLVAGRAGLAGCAPPSWPYS
jgi:hypothetical protein